MKPTSKKGNAELKGPVFSLITSFMPRYHTSSKKSYDSYTKISYTDRKRNIVNPIYGNHDLTKQACLPPELAFECKFIKVYPLVSYIILFLPKF